MTAPVPQLRDIVDDRGCRWQNIPSSSHADVVWVGRQKDINKHPICPACQFQEQLLPLTCWRLISLRTLHAILDATRFLPRELHLELFSFYQDTEEQERRVAWQRYVELRFVRHLRQTPQRLDFLRIHTLEMDWTGGHYDWSDIFPEQTQREIYALSNEMQLKNCGSGDFMPRKRDGHWRWTITPAGESKLFAHRQAKGKQARRRRERQEQVEEAARKQSKILCLEGQKTTLS